MYRTRGEHGGAASAWTAFNAVTAWFDHQRTVRGVSDRLRADQRLLGNWWGEAAVAKAKAWEMAMQR